MSSINPSSSNHPGLLSNLFTSERNSGSVSTVIEDRNSVSGESITIGSNSISLKDELSPNGLNGVAPDSQTDLDPDNVKTAGAELEEDPWNGRIVMSIDGGGIRGFFQLLLLKEILQMIKRIERERDIQEGIVRPLAGRVIDSPARERCFSIDDANIYHYVDFIVGSSTGGIVSVILGKLRATPQDGLRFYKKIGEKVFGNPNWIRFFLLSPFTRLLPKTLNEKFPNLKGMCTLFSTSKFKHGIEESIRELWRARPWHVVSESQPGQDDRNKRQEHTSTTTCTSSICNTSTDKPCQVSGPTVPPVLEAASASGRTIKVEYDPAAEKFQTRARISDRGCKTAVITSRVESNAIRSEIVRSWTSTVAPAPGTTAPPDHFASFTIPEAILSTALIPGVFANLEADIMVDGQLRRHIFIDAFASGANNPTKITVEDIQLALKKEASNLWVETVVSVGSGKSHCKSWLEDLLPTTPHLGVSIPNISELLNSDRSWEDLQEYWKKNPKLKPKNTIRIGGGSVGLPVGPLEFKTTKRSTSATRTAGPIRRFLKSMSSHFSDTKNSDTEDSETYYDTLEYIVKFEADLMKDVNSDLKKELEKVAILLVDKRRAREKKDLADEAFRFNNNPSSQVSSSTLDGLEDSKPPPVLAAGQS